MVLKVCLISRIISRPLPTVIIKHVRDYFAKSKPQPDEVQTGESNASEKVAIFDQCFHF